MMAAPDGQPAAVQQELMRLLPAGVPTRSLPRTEFYAAVREPTTALVIVTGEERRFANLLVTIGVAKKDQR